MGINIEFNPDLALRHHSEYREGNRKIEECLPERMEVGKNYKFLKKGQRNYWLKGEIPLLETKGSENLSRPLASIVIQEATHYLEDDNVVYTAGTYKIVEIFDPNSEEIHFEGYERIRNK